MPSNQQKDVARTGGAAQDDDMGCSITIVNQSGEPLILNSAPEPSSGGYTRNPPERIDNDESCDVRARGTSGTATGVDLHFIYQLGNHPSTTFKWKCNIPYDGEDSFSVTSQGTLAGNYAIVPPSYNPSHHNYLTYTTTITKVSS